jgi:hypothetical protein
MIGDFRTDALHQALKEREITDQTLIALLVVALAGKNVSVQSGLDIGAWDREAIRDTIAEGDVLTADDDLIRTAARKMLAAVLSCRDNMSNSGIGARIAGEAIGASVFLPTMATDEFLSCLSRQALERAAGAEGMHAEVRVKDTRARLVDRFKGATYHYPAALFGLTAEELDDRKTEHRHHVRGHAGDGEDNTVAQDEGLDGDEAGAAEDDGTLPEAAD